MHTNRNGYINCASLLVETQTLIGSFKFNRIIEEEPLEREEEVDPNVRGFISLVVIFIYISIQKHVLNKEAD